MYKSSTDDRGTVQALAREVDEANTDDLSSSGPITHVG